MTHDVKFQRDSAICKTAEGLVSFRYAKKVLLYAATPDEIDVTGIAEAAWAKGKTVLFPKCDKATHTMEYYAVNSYDELKVDAYGILEPSSDCPKYDPKNDREEAVCFVPGLVYDKSGYRLGYGKGFYDRYLSGFSGCRIGVVYSDFILDEVPRGYYDVSVDILLTEKGVRVTKDSNKAQRGKG